MKMSLGVMNLYYFLVGVFVFLIMKFIVSFDYFAKENLPTHKIAKVWHFIFGILCILVGVNGIFAMVQIKAAVGVFDYRHVLPTIMLFLSAVIFLSDSFKNPSKNYLVALGIGVIISIVGFFITLILVWLGPENVFGTHITYINYLLLIPFIAASSIGMLVGLLLYYRYFKRRREAWNESLWDKSRIWSILNNQYFILAFCIIMYFEIWFQWHSTSLIALLIEIM
jgi:hypothetical protein